MKRYICTVVKLGEGNNYSFVRPEDRKEIRRYHRQGNQTISVRAYTDSPDAVNAFIDAKLEEAPKHFDGDKHGVGVNMADVAKLIGRNMPIAIASGVMIYSKSLTGESSPLYPLPKH